MPQSSDTNFNVTSSQVIDSALRVLGVIRSGDTSNNDTVMEADCLQALNYMMKHWQNEGIQLWKRKQATLNLTAGTVSYDITTPTTNIVPLRIISAYRRMSNVDVVMKGLSRDEYDSLSNKSSVGIPTQYFYDYLANSGRIYLWPVADSSTNTNTNVIFTYHAPFTDEDVVSDNLDLPQSGLEAAKWNLAIRLAPEFGKTVTPFLMQMAAQTKEQFFDSQYEEGSIFFRPSYRYK